jgi:hypothetical protein
MRRRLDNPKLHGGCEPVTSGPLPLIEKTSDLAKRKERGLAREETKALKDHIVALYYERYTCRQIADLTGLSYRYVRDSLKERGIKLGGRPTGSSRRAVVRAHSSGCSNSDS